MTSSGSIIYDANTVAPWPQGCIILLPANCLQTAGAGGVTWQLYFTTSGQIQILCKMPGRNVIHYTSNIPCPFGIAPDYGRMSGTFVLYGTNLQPYADAISSTSAPPIAGACLVLTASGFAQIGVPAPTTNDEASSLIAHGFGSVQYPGTLWWQSGSFVAVGAGLAAAAILLGAPAGGSTDEEVSVKITTTVTVEETEVRHSHVGNRVNSHGDRSA